MTVYCCRPGCEVCWREEKPVFRWKKLHKEKKKIKKRKRRDWVCWPMVKPAVTSEYSVQDSSPEDTHAELHCYEVPTMVPMYHVLVRSLANELGTLACA